MEPLHTDGPLQIRAVAEPHGLQLPGQVDLTNQADLPQRRYDLDHTEADETVHLRSVAFLSFTALRLLVCFAQTLLSGRHPILLTPGPQVRALPAACGWEHLPSLTLVASDV